MPLFFWRLTMEVTKEELYLLISTLVAVIGVLWGLMIKNFNQKEEALKAKEEALKSKDYDHKECLDKVTELTAKVSYLEGKTEGIAQLSTALLEKLDSISCEIKESRQ